MPIIDFSSGVWDASFNNAEEFCTNANNAAPNGLNDPASGARIEMEIGLMKVVHSDVGQGMVGVLGVTPVACDIQTNTPIPLATARIVLPSPQGFVRFKVATFRAATVQVTYYAGTDRTQQVGQESHVYTGDAQNHEFRRNSPCALFRLVVIDVPIAAQNSFLQNVRFEFTQPILGRVFPVNRLFCQIQRLLSFVGLIRR